MQIFARRSQLVNIRIACYRSASSIEIGRSSFRVHPVYICLVSCATLDTETDNDSSAPTS